ncbi:hypothetical protein [Vibrio marisflavi]|uniref:DNA polymerase III subunit beta n=1 Tax=Vibrio marisflavi CECT 7928 TaxID=634439 RepID=A0ABM9A2I0_9VIBR|nr:hypothetical protein [Vibrio marisflavi]CAH0538752.1 hypothetical protein VMF7928_01642 [Vibrio marisflavi CECT 7928]
MKKFLLASLVLVLLAGCSSAPQGIWCQDNQAQVSGDRIVMKSNLWVTNVPATVEGQDQTLHGTLYLDSHKPLPPNLGVVEVSVKQGDKTWVFYGEDLEVQTNYENQWQVAFEWEKVPVNLAKPVDVALQVKNGKRSEWLVEQEVQVNSVE